MRFFASHSALWDFFKCTNMFLTLPPHPVALILTRKGIAVSGEILNRTKHK